MKIERHGQAKILTQQEIGTFPAVEDELPAVPLPREQLSQLSQPEADSWPEEIPDW